MSFTGSLEDCIRWLENQPDGEYEVRRKRKNRSLTQNAYYWKMVGEVSQATGVPTEEIHMEMLRGYAPHEVFTVKVEVPIGRYVKYWDVVGSGWLDGTLYNHVRVYTRSSEMDSAEFSRLIDGMRQECEQLGIPFKTPEEISKLRFAEPDFGTDRRSPNGR